MKIIITGASGFIGSSVVSFLEQNDHEIYKLVRREPREGFHEIFWDPQKGKVDKKLLEGFDAVIHLGGENLMGFWTSSKKEKIVKSRVNSTEFLGKIVCSLARPPSVFICASAVGYYGNRGDEILTEASAKGEGFLSDICEQWEKASSIVDVKGIRRVNIRLGIVVSPEGGALKLMLPIFKLGLGGKLGNGRQYMSWIALQDLVRVIETTLRDERLFGPINAVSPYSMTNEDWTKALGSILHRPTFFSVPTFLIRLILGQFGEEVLLSSIRAKPQKLEGVNFKFDYPILGAYRDLL